MDRFLYGKIKEESEEFLGLTKEEWKEILGHALKLGLSIALTLWLFKKQQQMLRDMTSDKTNKGQEQDILKNIEKHLKRNANLFNKRSESEGSSEETKTRSESKFQSFSKSKPKSPIIKVKLTPQELSLAKHIIFTDTNEKFEKGFNLIGGLGLEIDQIRSAIIKPLQRSATIKQMLALEKQKDQSQNQSSDSSSSTKSNFKYPELEKAFKKYKLTQGVLLYGPPGCGKTQIAKCLAAESQMPLLLVDSSVLLSKWFGESNKLVASLWSLAAKISPCIIFIDEVDSLLSSRGQSMTKHEVSDQLLSIFLSKWEGLESEKQNIVFVGATNREKNIDEAALRRFTTKIEIKLPGVTQLEEILKIHLSDFDIHEISADDWKHLARTCKSYKFTGSDIRLLAEISTSSRIDKFLDEISDTGHDRDEKSNLKNLDLDDDLEDSKEVEVEADNVSLPESEFEGDVEKINFNNLMKCAEKVKKMKDMGSSECEFMLYS